MPVVVNEFEVVTEPQQQPAQNGAGRASEAKPETPDMELELNAHYARARRVRAY